MDNATKKKPVPTLALDADVDAWLKANTGPDKPLSRQSTGSALLRTAIIRFEGEGRRLNSLVVTPLRVPAPEETRQ